MPLIVLPKSCSCRCGPCPPPPSLVWVVCFLSFFLFEVDILWPRWVANNIPEDRTLGQGPIALRGGRGLPRPGALPTTIVGTGERTVWLAQQLSDLHEIVGQASTNPPGGPTDPARTLKSDVVSELEAISRAKKDWARDGPSGHQPPA